MRLLALARIHYQIILRQKMLWVTTIPLSIFAMLLAITSPTKPGTGSIEDLAFAGQVLAMLTGIAYAAAFADFFTVSSRLGVAELEASTPVTPLMLGVARILGTVGIVIMPSLGVLAFMGFVQTIGGSYWSIPASLVITATIILPAALFAMSLSALAGVILRSALGRIAGVMVWFLLIFSTPSLPLPTPNGTVFTVVGDPVVAGYFDTSPLYPPSGAFAYDATAWSATLSLVIQFISIAIVLAAASALAGRSGQH